MSTHALIATATFHGEVLQHRFDPGAAVEIGNRPPLALPLPAGVPWVAKVEWVRPSVARVTDPQGRQYELKSDETLEIEFGTLRLDLELAPQFTLRRTETFPWRLSTGWLVVVLVFTIFTRWYAMFEGKEGHRRVCEIFGFTPELAVSLGCVSDQANGGGVDFTAEYLARLLKKDYAGDENGMIERLERPDDGVQEKTDIYLPSGNEGPVTDLGGAEEVAPDAIKAPRSEAEPEPEPLEDPGKQEEITLFEVPEDVGTPIELPTTTGLDEEEDGEGSEDAVTDAEEVVQPAEEERGWGIQDWYDEADRQLDDLEIEYMQQTAKRRLRIDPNDPTALSLLSYYQYLAADYPNAEKTYDRFIELFPEEAAGYNNKALVYKRRKQYKKEESLYRVALALEPLDVTAMNNLGVNLAHQGRYDEALMVMQQLEILDPVDAYADLHRAKIHAEMGNNELAYTYLQKSLEGMAALDTLHHIEFRQDIRIDTSFSRIRESKRFRDLLVRYYGNDTPVKE